MQDLTPEERRAIERIALRHGVSTDAALTLLQALRAGNGAMAQFSHAELGGMGQWSQGGMTMVGDMFNHALKARVDAVCSELAEMLRTVTVYVAEKGVGPSGEWWPPGLGRPSTTGGQNDLRYAFFPDT